MENWYSKLSSPADKEVLIKAVITTLSSYCMSCFMLPMKLIKHITTVTRKYWWSSQQDKGKISWISWDKLTNHKGKRGLGIRYLKVFNIALLAK